MIMDIKDKVVFITGGVGGIGWALTKEFCNRAASKVYVTYLNDSELTIDAIKTDTEVIFIKLDVTDLSQVKSVSAQCTAADIVINNAGVEFAKSFSDKDTLKAAELEHERKLSWYALCCR